MAALGASGLFALTLSACYGAPIDGPYMPSQDGGPSRCVDPSMDLDGDGYCGAQDCDEEDAERHVGAPDPEGDGKDQDCDGVDGRAM